MDNVLRPPRVFISAVTSELGLHRARLREIFHSHGAEVIVQRPYPNKLDGGDAIAREIEASDLAVCLIGHNYGMARPTSDTLDGVPPWYSWTEWECHHARKHAKKICLFFYNGPEIGKPEDKECRDRQKQFRDDLSAELKSTLSGKFRYWFQTTDELEKYVVQFVESADGALATFQAGTWAKIKDQHRAWTIREWCKDFPKTYRGEDVTSEEEKQALMEASQAPFIASQGFSLLVPNDSGEQAQFLKPAAFLPGRDTETEARARENSVWNPIAREDVVRVLRSERGAPITSGGIDIPPPIRLFFVSGGGVGKTTNLRWLEATLNGLHAGVEPAVVLAIMVNGGALVGLDDGKVLEFLTAKIANMIGASESEFEFEWARKAIAKGLEWDAAAGRLVILIDGLDHVESGKIPLLTSIQSRAPGRRWSPCAVVAAGRPHAVQGWKDRPTQSGTTIALSEWRFIEPAEFTPDQSEVFLGKTGTSNRYEIVNDQLGSLVRLPRVLEYVRTLPAAKLIGVRTSADIYTRALGELIVRTLKDGGERAREIGPTWAADCKLQEPPGHQIKYIMKLLSSLAFLSLCPTSDPAIPMDSQAFRMGLNEEVRRELRARMSSDPGVLYEADNLERDFRALARFASILGNGVLDEPHADAASLDSIIWSNRTIHQYLAAYWYAVHAQGFDAIAHRLQGQSTAIEPEDPKRDSDRLRNYVFYPEDTDADANYELNVFLAEMPATALTPKSWVASTSAWYDSNLHAHLGRAATERRWSTEMLYRSWTTMHDIAGYPYDDWWDLPYDMLIKTRSGKQRAEASVHRTRDTTGLGADTTARRVARSVLERFFSDFDGILKDAHDAKRQALGQSIIAEQDWLRVPAGSLQMGSPPEKQGFPPKVKAYWIKDIEEVRHGKSAYEVALHSTKSEWFTAGAQGRRLRERDIQWLTDTFRLADPQAKASIAGAPGDNGCQDALKTLETKWSRRDETPAENPQAVAEFFMHRLPVLHAWFYLFAPGHQAAVQSYLGSTRHPDPDRPAIYISWFDAWAFCQWAIWTVNDATHPSGKRGYGLRLPHEPEWEYATRWTTSDAGIAEPIPYGQRYWWGDTFYQREDNAEEEPLSCDVAHAIGKPGCTRAPSTAKPNGLGFQDILGNVWEWTANLYDTRKEEDTNEVETMQYSRNSPTIRPPVNCSRTMRGGLWYYLDLLANCSARFRLTCDDRDYKMGFRVVREERSLT